ncbi:hypothetical protein PIB30_051662 [Stylosanthes scabra]|nr:hypothetical protein [Stylosanthes scabra]
MKPVADLSEGEKDDRRKRERVCCRRFCHTSPPLMEGVTVNGCCRRAFTIAGQECRHGCEAFLPPICHCWALHGREAQPRGGCTKLCRFQAGTVVPPAAGHDAVVPEIAAGVAAVVTGIHRR